MSAAHELRTPLTTLLAQAQDMERRLAGGAGEAVDVAAVRRIAREASRLRFLIQELLDAGALDGGSIPIERTPVDLVGLARRACASRSGPACAVEASGPVVGLFDARRMRVVLESLVDNAVKYGAGAPSRILVWKQEGRACIAVQDRGTGIPPADLAHVFDRSYRGGNAADQAVPGLGLGLYLARAIVQAHGGALAIHSTPFDGTTVTALLPCPEASMDGGLRADR